MNTEGNGMNYRATLLNEEDTVVDVMFNDSQRGLLNTIDKLYMTHRLGQDVRVKIDAVVRTSDDNWIVTDNIADFVLDTANDSVYN